MTRERESPTEGFLLFGPAFSASRPPGEMGHPLNTCQLNYYREVFDSASLQKQNVAARIDNDRWVFLNDVLLVFRNIPMAGFSTVGTLFCFSGG